MPLKYACFLSHRFSNYTSARARLESLFEALCGEVDEHCDMEVFYGSREYRSSTVEDDIAEALCKSVCMVVLYTPKYFSNEKSFCAREFVAMEKLENLRLSIFDKDYVKRKRLIIPILYRGDEKSTPRCIRENPRFEDFSKFTLTKQAWEHEAVAGQLPKIAKYIAERTEDFEKAHKDKKIDISKDCLRFKLPTERRSASG